MSKPSWEHDGFMYFRDMKVCSVNTARPTLITWNGRDEYTGIYKTTAKGPIKLRKYQVAGDCIANRKVHGGLHKACYLFSTRHYPYWKKRYPDLDWQWGMFGENISLDDMDEEEMRIGDTYRIGNALVEVTMPREPCYKLGVRFGTQKILRDFIDFGYPGAYVRILENGEVWAGDVVELVEQSANPLSIRQFFTLLYQKEKTREWVQLALENPALPRYKRESLIKYK